MEEFICNATIYERKEVISPNYRPISLTSNASKLFERIVFEYHHMVENDLLYRYQSGFLPRHSTDHHLIKLTHNACLSLENHEANCQVFCDISKDFDRVWHECLLHKLEKYSVKGDFYSELKVILNIENKTSVCKWWFVKWEIYKCGRASKIGSWPVISFSIH